MKKIKATLIVTPADDLNRAEMGAGLNLFMRSFKAFNEALDHKNVVEIKLTGFPLWDCSTCRDTKEVSADEKVYASEPHVADVGTQPCPDCQLNNN